MKPQFESELSVGLKSLGAATHELVMAAYRQGIKDGITSAAKGLRSGGDLPTTLLKAGDLVDTMAQEYDVNRDR